MVLRLFKLTVPCVLVWILMLAGCSLTDATTEYGHEVAVDTSDAHEIGQVVLEMVEPPEMTVTDYELPPGCQVCDFTQSLAVYDQVTYKEYPLDTIGLLNLESGECRTVLPTPVGADERFCALAPMLSDDWLVWEEISENEGYDMDHATWRLYAAKINYNLLSIGEPILVDEGYTLDVTRPFYNVWNDEIVWSRVNHPHSDEEKISDRHSEILALELTTGNRRTIAESDNCWRAITFSEDYALVTEYIEPESGEYAINVFDLGTGNCMRRVLFTAQYGTSHFAAYVGDRVYWSVFATRQSSWPSLYCADASGTVMKVRPSSMDTCGVGRYAFCESYLREQVLGDDHYNTIVGIDIESGTTWFLEKTHTGFWQLPMHTGWHEDTLIACLDLGGYTEEENGGKTIVRRWVVTDE